jgi:FKBP-type peptidyl-prolyl cis-trans isomerase (trigger factor)
MKVEVKKVDALKRELHFEIPQDRVSKTLEAVYQELGKVAKIRGFRPGKAPRHVLEAEHGAVAQEETIKKLIPEVYHEALEQEKIEPIDLPEIHDVNFKGGKITFTAKLDVKPDVQIKDYKGIKVERKSSEVKDEEITKYLETLKQAQGKGQDVPLDDAFARGIGYPSLDDFKKSLTRELEREKDRQNRYDVENQIIDELLKKAKLAVPESMIKKQMERRFQDAVHRLRHQGLKDADIKKQEEDIRKSLREPVEKDVKVFLILDKIAQLENISAQENEQMPMKVIEFLLKEAKWDSEKA